MLGLTLATYTAPGGTRRVVVALAPAAPTAPAGRRAAARLAAALVADGGLVIDRDASGAPPRVVAELAVGEGLAVARAVVDDYLPRARRATAPIARALAPGELETPRAEERAA